MLKSQLLLILLTLAQPSLGSWSDSRPINYDFCELSSVNPRELLGPFPSSLRPDRAAEFSPDLWDAVSVQYFTRRLLSEPSLIDTPVAAYPLSYVAMTAARDAERCAGSLASSDRNDRLIGDLLADVMSRWLVLSTRACSASGQISKDDHGLCAAIKRIEKGRYDAVRAALEITGVYLSSHMAMALAAVVHDDQFWQQEFPEDTHCKRQDATCSYTTIKARLVYMHHYKTHYDRNNAFLAANLNTVITSLKQSCYIKGSILSGGVSLFGPTLDRLQIIGNIRDLTFQSGLELARTLRRHTHPMLEPKADGYGINYVDFRQFSHFPEPLVKAENHARRILALPALASGLHILGSISADQLQRSKPSQNPSCDYPMIRAD